MIKDPELLNAIASVLDGTPSEDELHLVNNWLLEDQNNQLLFESLMNPAYRQKIEKEAAEAKDRMYLNIQDRKEPKLSKRTFNIWKPVAAAIILIFVLLGMDFLKKTPSTTIAQVRAGSLFSYLNDLFSVFIILST